MKVKLDENMPAAMATLLRDAGHDVSTVADQGLGGAGDPQVLQAAVNEGRLLITFDLHFADVRRYPAGSHAEIVVFRLQDQRWVMLERPARRLVESDALPRVAKGLAIVDEVRIRIRAVGSKDAGQ